MTTSARVQLILAIALIATELMAGMQAYLSQLILPIMAADFDAQRYYGLIVGVGTIAQFVGLPLGATLIHRFRLAPLLLVLTLVICAGAVISATAPSIWIYLLGTLIRSFAGGCMAIVSIGAVALGLEGRARRLTLAFSSASWIIASIVGPLYAAWVTQLLSWRWAMLMYLPLLLVCRWVIATHLGTDRRSSAQPPMHIGAALILGAGLVLTIVPVTGVVKLVLAVIGVAVMIVGAVRVLPTGTFGAASPRHGMLAFLFFMTGVYFAANEMTTLTVHDVYLGDAGMLGWVILAGGLCWAVMGLIMGAAPSKSPRALTLRMGIGSGLITLALVGVCAAMVVTLSQSLGLPEFPGLSRFLDPSSLDLDAPLALVLVFGALWGIAGIGIGTMYVDSLDFLFTDTEATDGLSMETVASASILVESIASAIIVTLASTAVGTFHSAQTDSTAAASGSGATAAVGSAAAGSAAIAADPLPYWIVWIALAVLSLVPIGYVTRIHAARAREAAAVA